MKRYFTCKDSKKYPECKRCPNSKWYSIYVEKETIKIIKKPDSKIFLESLIELDNKSKIYCNCPIFVRNKKCIIYKEI